MIKCCISIKELYNKYGSELNYGYDINHSYEEETDTHYYDLVDCNGNILCMDGEECEIHCDGPWRYMFINSNGTSYTKFCLTEEEMNTAVFAIPSVLSFRNDKVISTKADKILSSTDFSADQKLLLVLKLYKEGIKTISPQLYYALLWWENSHENKLRTKLVNDCLEQIKEYLK